MNRRERLGREKKKLVLTNGCFDLLHSGHIYFLNTSATLGDVLWVALNGDKSIRKLKGPTRPIQNETERAYNLAALNCIQGIITFNTERLDAEILSIKPDVYVKAGDYSLETINKSERQALESAGTEIIFLPYLNGYSTTELIKRINRSTS